MPSPPKPQKMETIEKPIFRVDYEMELVDEEWLKGAVKPKSFIDFIPEQCILCEGCVDILFLIDDNACTRCNLCVERCPTGALVQSQVTGGKKKSRGARALGTVPETQKAS